MTHATIEGIDWPRPWTSFADADRTPPKFYGVTVTAEHFHMPVGTDRGAVSFDASSLALAGIYAGCNAVSLSTYRGEASMMNYGVVNMIGGRPFVNDSIRRAQIAPLARFAHRRFEELEGYAEPVDLLDLMINSDEAQLNIRSMDESVIDPKVWAAYLDQLVRPLLLKCVQPLPRKNRQAMKKLVRDNTFISSL